MKKQNQTAILKQKTVSIIILFSTALVIIFLGVFFSAFSFINHISFRVLNSQIPGVIFGLLVLYLGLRYYLSVNRLKEEVYKNTTEFSWRNFKKVKKN
jgi:hypothetical protein